MNYSLHTNYQTSFRITRVNGQTHYDLIRTIYDWLCTKEKEPALKNEWKEFGFKGTWEHCKQTNAKIQTATCLEGEHARAWAMEYSHSDRELGARRFWHTHVGLRDTGEDLIVAVRIAFSWNNEDLSSEPPAPSPSVPYFIRRLLKNFRTFSGRREFRLIEKPVTFKTVGSGKLVKDFVFSPERRYPLIVFNGDSEANTKESKRLATELAGKAQVVMLASDPALGRELFDVFPKDFHIAHGRMRVFFPMGFGPPNGRRHRWFDVNSKEYVEQREGIVHGLLRNHNLVERGSVETIADVHRLISKAKIAKLAESSEGANEDEIQALYQDYINEVEIERDSSKQEAEHYAQQVDQLESALQAAEWKNKALEQAAGAKATDLDVRSLFFTIPETLPDVVRMASELHAERLVFAQEAFSSAEESAGCELIADAWCIFSHLATTLYDLKFDSDTSGDISKQFQDKSGYEYARTEGKQTKSDSKLVRLRKITHNGKDYEIWPHIKKGNEGNKMIRIHFDFDNDDKKIVVGYVGLHMDNASTRGRK